MPGAGPQVAREAGEEVSHVVFLRAMYYAAGRHDQKMHPGEKSVDPGRFAKEADERNARSTEDMQRIYEELQP